MIPPLTQLPGDDTERNEKDRELSQILTALIHNFRTYGPGSVNGELVDQIELAYQHLHDEEPKP